MFNYFVYAKPFTDICRELNHCRCLIDQVFCSNLSDLKTLGTSKGGYNIKKLTIENILSEERLCTPKDVSNSNCKERTTVIIPRLSAFHFLTDLVILGTNLVYISDNFFKYFNMLTTLLIQGNDKLTELPFPSIYKHKNTAVKSISYIDNCNVTRVHGSKIAQFKLQHWSLNEEGCHANTKNITLYINSINVIPDNLAFSVKLKRNASVFMQTPYTTASETINSISAEFNGYGHKNVRLNFKHTRGKIRSFYFKFNRNGSESNNFLKTIPVRFFGDSEATYIVNDQSGNSNKYFFSNDIHTFENSAEIHAFDDLNDKHKQILSREDMNVLRLHSNKYRDLVISEGNGTYKHPLRLVCGIFDLEQLNNLIENSPKRRFYEINTLILYLGRDEELSKQFHGKITVRYQTIIMARNCKLHYFKYEPKGKTVSPGEISFYAVDNFTTNGNFEQWRILDSDFIYRILLLSIDVSKPDVYRYTSPKLQKAKWLIASKLLESINTKNPRTKGTMHYMENAINKIHEVLLFVKIEFMYEHRIPINSPILFRKKTLVLQEIARKLFKIKHLKFFQDVESALLDIGRIRSQTLMKIEEEQRNELITKEDATYAAFKNLKKLRVEYESKLKRNKTTLSATAADRNPEVEAIHVIIDMLVKSKFNIKTFFINSEEGLTKKLENVSIALKSLTNIIKNLSYLIKVINQKIYNLKTNHNDKGTLNLLEDADEIATDNIEAIQMTNTLEETFNPRDALEIADIIGTIHASELSKWDIVKKQLEMMIDVLSLPTNIKYLAILLNFIEAGKAESQALLELAQIHADVYITDYKVHAYQKETFYIEQETQALSREHENTQDLTISKNIKRNLKLIMKQLKIDIFLHLAEYCRLSFYHTLQPCLAFDQYQIDISLRQIMHIIHWMINEPIENAISLYPPPQTFRDISISFKLDKRCAKIYEIEKKTTNKTKQFWLFTKLTKPMKHENISVAYRKFFKLYEECITSPVAKFKMNNACTIEVALTDEAFRSFDRVRVDEIQVFLHGAKTESNTVQINIANIGVVKDRLGDSQFVFTGGKWQRICRYAYKKIFNVVNGKRKTIHSYSYQVCIFKI